MFFCPLSNLFDARCTLAPDVVALQNLCDDSLRLGTTALLGANFPVLGYNRFLEYCLRFCSCFPALSKELEAGRASVSLLHVMLLCIVYF